MHELGAFPFLAGEWLIACNKVPDMPAVAFTLNGVDYEIQGAELVIEVRGIRGMQWNINTAIFKVIHDRSNDILKKYSIIRSNIG